jgi:hypothetical protein
LLELERERRWRLFVWISMMVGLVAGFTSGARGNFIFMPLIFIMVQFFKFRASGLVQGVIGLGIGLIGALSIAGIDGGKIFGEAANLTTHYGQEIALGGLLEGLERGGIFGLGVGANTGAARHGLDAATAALVQEQGLLIENYYAKALVELGAVGFTIVLAWTVLLFIHCLQVQRRLRLLPLKGVASCCTAMVAFIMLVSFKGWALDTDPLNYYYYLLMGMVFALPFVERQWFAAAQRTAAAVPPDPPAGALPEPATRGTRPGLPDRSPDPAPLRPLRLPVVPRIAGVRNPSQGGSRASGVGSAGDDFELGPRLRRPTPKT